VLSNVEMCILSALSYHVLKYRTDDNSVWTSNVSPRIAEHVACGRRLRSVHTTHEAVKQSFSLDQQCQDQDQDQQT